MDGRIVDIAYEECAKNKEGAKEDEQKTGRWRQDGQYRISPKFVHIEEVMNAVNKKALNTKRHLQLNLYKNFL